VERRKFTRFTITQAVELQFGRERFIHVEATDLSRGGIGCVSIEPVDLHTDVFVMVNLVRNDQTDSITANAHVVRCESNPDGRYSLGLEFTSMLGSSEALLLAHLDAT